MWSTRIITLFHKILQCSKEKPCMPSFTSKNAVFEPAQSHLMRHYCIPTTLIKPQSPLFIAMMIGSDTEGEQTRSPVCFLAQIPAGNSKLNLWLWECSEKWFIITIRPGTTSLDMEPWHNLPEAAAILRARHKHLPHPHLATKPRAAGLGSGWEPPGCRLLIKADWFFSWWEKNMRMLNYLRVYWLHFLTSLSFEGGSVRKHVGSFQSLQWSYWV